MAIDPAVPPITSPACSSSPATATTPQDQPGPVHHERDGNPARRASPNCRPARLTWPRPSPPRSLPDPGLLPGAAVTTGPGTASRTIDSIQVLNTNGVTLAGGPLTVTGNGARRPKRRPVPRRNGCRRGRRPADHQRGQPLTLAGTVARLGRLLGGVCQRTDGPHTAGRAARTSASSSLSASQI